MTKRPVGRPRLASEIKKFQVLIPIDDYRAMVAAAAAAGLTVSAWLRLTAARAIAP